jgi:hypothetical protein
MITADSGGSEELKVFRTAQAEEGVTKNYRMKRR